MGFNLLGLREEGGKRQRRQKPGPLECERVKQGDSLPVKPESEEVGLLGPHLGTLPGAADPDRVPRSWGAFQVWQDTFFFFGPGEIPLGERRKRGANEVASEARGTTA